ncbi:hypothetical protein, partial [Bacillus thuringiensis]
DHLDIFRMEEYRKKPVVIEAFKFYVDSIPDWLMDKITSNDIVLHNCNYKRYGINKAYCEIKTLEGVMIGNGGDYISKSVNGEIYPCKADIFENTYEQADGWLNLGGDQWIYYDPFDIRFEKDGNNSTEKSVAGKRVESKVDNLRFYSKPSWADKNVVSVGAWLITGNCNEPIIYTI